MLEGLDSIAWGELTHAYGPAADVPGLIRGLATARADMAYEESPLWKLFGNIHHQGTVYQATSFAVPFLLDLAADSKTPDRLGILHLLAEIAKGTSYRDVHGNRPNDPDFENKREQEMKWVAAAHEAVAAGFELLVPMTEEKGDIPMAGAHVLAQLPAHREAASALILKMLDAETRSLYRAGFLLLLGQAGDRSKPVFAALVAALKGKNKRQRRAAAVAIAHLKPKPFPAIARKAIASALADEDIDEHFEGLPWDVGADIDLDEMRSCMGATAREKSAEKLIVAIETGKATHNKIERLLDNLFPTKLAGLPVLLKHSDLSPLQARAVRALAKTVEGPDRVFIGLYRCWGLPESRRLWRDLAAGRDPVPVDMTLPMFAHPEDPRRRLYRIDAKVGNRVRHREYGLGTFVRVEQRGDDTSVTVEFDDEESAMFQMPLEPSP